MLKVKSETFVFKCERCIQKLSRCTVCYSNKFHFRFVLTILLQLTTQEIRERTIKEQENLYNSEMHRYDQHGNSPHNGTALPNGKVTRT